ncbi:hypothetical protein [Actinophytocola oryzae]|uniref:DUF3558 domain-containing protein n=1 Tax=Actinophytocola oryzae TaxID=502181 RepID=A0A4R7UT19_9PSEU|nr:hypothetical protein [Actinophytocola oryzae]TDV39739.1 hypothetical protein CLV71_12551 [Actinophytocola oryzae]
MSKPAVLPRVIAVVALMALSACTSRYGGMPTAGETLPEPKELTATSVFEDLTTVAPCSLTDPSAFDTVGSARYGEPELTLDYCTILVETADDRSVTVNVGLLEELATLPEMDHQRDVERGLWVGQRPDGSTCAQLLVFPDGITVEVYAYESPNDADTCEIAEAAMNHVIQVVLDGHVTHREPALNSFVTLDPCGLITDEDVAAVPGLTGMRKPYDYPGKHKCRWAREGAGVVVAFGAGRPPATSQPVAGRPTATNPVDLPERSYCTVETGHIPFTEVPGVADQVELASVYVHMPPGQATAACTAARALAEALWPQLPAA